ncbi:hypothetical protein GCM10011611_14140 [Aliidongia dinghuensis]|uniref:Peptidase S8/S53 domain-containing protein n=1 Tax=Aliidongia dinghuensis TaxID=1867774 RepID=A0A8J2YS00_9PROT|nr:S8 family serine peptidase [Aliidongia dinghuensis]GGF09799.1 hypothetical protein GCM10011611_14140 [Aliidongia dinghuensis]
MASEQRYLILPKQGFYAPQVGTVIVEPNAGGTIQRLSRTHVVDEGRPLEIKVVDRIGKNGPAVAALDPQDLTWLRREARDIRVLPNRKYHRAIRPLARASYRALSLRSGSAIQTRIFVKERGTGRPLQDVTVIAIVDRATNAGVRRRTGATGQATITLPGSTVIEQLFIYPPAGFWGFHAQNHDLKPGEVFELDPLEIDYRDFLKRSFPMPAPENGGGVKVGVIDTGIDLDHPDIVVSGGCNFVLGEDMNDFGPADGHGTHVAGIIAGKRTGLAPKAEIYSYRVFPYGGGPADTVAISKAIDRAIADGCDFINLSLGGGVKDDALNEAIGAAFEQGCVCIAAAGNSGRSPVGYPAWIKRSLAVSAIGHCDTFPKDSVEAGDIADPRSANDPGIFVAGFSNVGRELDFTAPGVGIISTWIDKGYAVESGTSMACPAVTGAGAALLSRDPGLLKAVRNSRRALGIKELLERSAQSMGLPQSFEGLGQPTI